MYKQLLAVLVAALLLGGCAVTPAVSQPETPTTAVTTATAATTVTAPTTEGTTAGTTTATAPTTTATTTTTKAPTTTKAKLTADQIYKSLKRADRDCEEYDFDKYMAPYWEGNVVYNESVLPLEEADGTVAPITLMFPADRILAVHDAQLNLTYTEGKDYALEDGKLVILPEGRISTYAHSKMYSDTAVPGWFAAVDGTYQFFAEGTAFHNMQLAVSYIHTAEWTGPVPQSKASNLPRTAAALKNGDDLSVVFFGCSTALGGNSSGFVGVAPNAPSWTQMTVESLKKAYPAADITANTVAKGGQTISNGLSQIAEVNGHKPDLVIMEFGMNEGAHKYSQALFVSEIKKAVDGIRAENPDCEFLLMSSWVPNRELKNYDWPEEPFMTATAALEGEGFAVGDWWSPHAYVLQSKRYFDMTGNNVNHPNDFLARLMAQTVVATLLP